MLGLLVRNDSSVELIGETQEQDDWQLGENEKDQGSGPGGESQLAPGGLNCPCLEENADNAGKDEGGGEKEEKSEQFIPPGRACAGQRIKRQEHQESEQNLQSPAKPEEPGRLERGRNNRFDSQYNQA